jgi:nitrite reductase/ring-hydroxylating ferredoxin subunit
VAAVADIPDGEGRAFSAGGRLVAVFNCEGELFATDDACPHGQNAKLSMGFVEEGRVECPLHQSCFDLRTGKVLTPPADADVRVYGLKVEVGRVWVDV